MLAEDEAELKKIKVRFIKLEVSGILHVDLSKDEIVCLSEARVSQKFYNLRFIALEKLHLKTPYRPLLLLVFQVNIRPASTTGGAPTSASVDELQRAVGGIELNVATLPVIEAPFLLYWPIL